MKITIQGKQLDIGEALSSHVEDNLNTNVKKYFNNALDATIVFSKEAHLFRSDISVHAGRGMTMQGKATGADAYTAFDGALLKISKQLRRYKKRIQDHHKGESEADIMRAQYSVLAPEAGEEEVHEEFTPTIVAEMPTEIASLTVGEAVMRMDLADTPAMMFRNRAHGGLNVVYRREDGNIGWIDPNDTAKP